MENGTKRALLVGAAIYAAVVALRDAEGDMSGLQLVLILAAPLLMGLLAGGAKRGLLLGFTLSLALVLSEILILYPAALLHPIFAAAFLIVFMPLTLLSAVLGALGGLLGRRLPKGSRTT